MRSIALSAKESFLRVLAFFPTKNGSAQKNVSHN